MTSQNFSSKFGSLEILKVSSRCGLISLWLQMRWTVLLLTPASRAMERTLHRTRPRTDLQTTIYSLDDRGWSRRRIARELGIDRETVGRYLRLARPAISTAGLEEAGEAKPAISTAGNGV